MKVKVVFGKDANTPTGKSFLASQIAKGFDYPVFINGNRINCESRFAFNSVNENTDLLIVDDVPEKFAESLNELIFRERIVVEKKGKNPFVMNKPRIVITIPIHPKDFFKERGHSLFKRCDFIETNIYTSMKGIKTFVSKEVDPTELFQD